MRHYWTWKKEPDRIRVKICIKDMKKVLEHVEGLAHPSGIGEPLTTEMSLSFNDPQGNEETAFSFGIYYIGQERSVETGDESDYDTLITCLLLVARRHFDRKVLAIRSDGDYDPDWLAGAEFFESVFEWWPEPAFED